MKKIKYAGIAAATLLAVAPIIGESVVNTTEAQAAILPSLYKERESPEFKAAQAALAAVPDTVTYDNGNPCPNLGILANNMDNNLDAKALEKLNNELPFTKLGFTQDQYNKIHTFINKYFISLDGRGTGKMIIAEKQDKAEFTDQALKTFYRGGGERLAVHFRIFNYVGKNVGEKTITYINNGDYKNPAVPHSEVTQLAVNYADNITLPTEIETSKLKDTDNANVVAIDQNGTPLDYSTSVGDLYYSQQDAFRQSGKTYDEEKLPKTDVMFFQPITITFDRATSGVDLQKINDSMKQTAEKKGLSITDLIKQIISMGSKLTGVGIPSMPGMTQDQQEAAKKVSAISINGGTFTGFQSYPDFTNNSITFIRSLKVAPKVDPNKTPEIDPDHVNDAENWDVSRVAGTLNVGGRNADLVDDNGKPDNRELGAGTPWVTDQYRVNKFTQEGQYRVSTHEWVSEKDVMFKQVQGNQATNTAVGAFTSIDNIRPTTLHLSGNPVYKLYRKNGKVSNRSLAGNTDWYTDKVGYGKDGSRYYRVSTDEWVKLADGVQLK